MATTRQRLSAIAHARHPLACPFGDDKVARLIDVLDVPANATVLDVGCGQGEWLARILERHPGATGVGVDFAEQAIEAAAARTAKLSARVTLEHQEAASYLERCKQSFDLALCAGSCHALGGFTATLQSLRGVLAAGGKLLVGEGFWQQPPTARAQDVLSAEPDDLASLERTIEIAIENGYTPQYVTTSNQDEWDHYEWSWCSALERFAQENPHDPGAAEFVSVARSHRDGYISGYRGVLGFAALVLTQA